MKDKTAKAVRRFWWSHLPKCLWIQAPWKTKAGVVMLAVHIREATPRW